MPKNSVIASGNTTNEAVENGLKMLNVSRNMVNIKILENDEKRSFFSILAPRVVKVELTLKEDNNNLEENSKTEKKPISHNKEHKPVTVEQITKAENYVREFLNVFLKLIGNNVTYEINKDEFGLEIIIKGEEASFLIGYRGENLYAFQSIISTIANKNSTERVRVLVDIGDYKKKREKTLQDLAIKIAKTVERTKKPITLEPMQAYERKIIHSSLQNSTKVKTESIGEEPRRRVVISLK